MLKIIFDVKCGFEKLYLVEKGAEFNLDFLYINQAAFAEQYPDKMFLTEAELYNCYAGQPEILISDYNLLKVVKAILVSEYYAACFKDFKSELKRFFPELFVIENCKLVREIDTKKDNNQIKESDIDEFIKDDDSKRYDA